MYINADLLQCFIKYLIKRTSSSGNKNENMSDQQLTEELHKQITKKIQEKKVHSPFIDNLCGAQNTDMQLISKFDKGVHFLLSVTDIFSKYEWFITLKDEKVITITNALQKIQKNLIANQTKYG